MTIVCTIENMTIVCIKKKKNIVGQGENAGNQHFLLFPQCFPQPITSGVIKTQDCVLRGEISSHREWPISVTI